MIGERERVRERERERERDDGFIAWQNSDIFASSGEGMFLGFYKTQIITSFYYIY